jgi:DNA repair exonuclease SbcCD nuclease subunit
MKKATNTKVGIISDNHCGERTAFAKPVMGGARDGMNSRLVSSLEAIEMFTMFLVNSGIKHSIFGGDLFNDIRSTSVSTVDPVKETVLGHASRVESMVLLQGNHGRADWDMVRHLDNIFDKYEDRGITVAGDPMTRMYGKTLFHFVPYIHDRALLEDALKAAGEAAGKYKGKNVMVTHNGFQGVQLRDEGYNPDLFYKVPKKLFADFDLVLLGHIHKHQELPIAGADVVVIGSPQQFTFWDMGDDRGFLILDYETLEWEHRKLTLPEFKVVEIRSQEDIDAIKVGELRNFHTRFVLKDPSLKPGAFEHLCTAGPPQFVHEYSVSEDVRMSLPKDAGFDGAIEAYVDHEGEEWDEGTVKRRKSLGLEMLKEAGVEL